MTQHRYINRKFILTVTGTALVTFAVASCSLTSAEAPADGEKVVLMTHDSFNVTDEVLAQFEKNTGITVEVRPSGDAGTLANQLVLLKGKTDADVVFGIDNSYASRVIEADVLATAPDVSDVEFAPYLTSDEVGQLVPIDYSDVCVNVDHTWFREKNHQEPSTLADLTKAEFKNLLVVENAAKSSPGMSFLLATIGAAEAGDIDQTWQEYWTALMANGTKVVDSWTDAYTVDFSGGAGKGSRPLVVSYASSPPFTIEDGETEPPTGVMLDTCFRQTEYAGVVKGAANSANANKLIRFLLSDSFQRDIPGQMYMYPAVSATELPASWQAHAPLAKKPYVVATGDIDRNREDWLVAWTDVVTG